MNLARLGFIGGVAAFGVWGACASLAQPATEVATQPADGQTGDLLGEHTLTVDLDDSPISAVLQALDADARRYNEHITTLANPFFEGRAPGLRGNMLAAEYVAFNFRKLGLRPAFASEERVSDGSVVLTDLANWFQPFSTGETSDVRSAHVSAGGLGEMTMGRDYAVLAFSGDVASVDDAPLVFVGYAIQSGRDGYSSYEDDTDLTGKVAVILRFEPMDDVGRSRWLPGGWSPNAGVEAKFRSAARRGAAGIILVNPPGADDDRMGRLESLNSIGPQMGGPLDIPVVQMSEEAAGRLVRRADEHGRTLLDLRRLADEGTAVIDLPDERVSMSVEIASTPTMTQNVGAVLPGHGALADQYIVIGAHYDHVGYGYFGSRAGAAGAGVLHPGADDNGSGTSGMLLAAEMMTKLYAQLPEGAPARSILFLAFSGEELGLLGSEHYVNNPIVPIERHVFMLNMDMIGRLRDGVMELGGVRTAEGLWEWLEPKVAASGLDVHPLPGGVGPSDHTNFYNKGMPVLFLHTLLHDEYHMPSDFSWTINQVGAVRVVRLCVDIAMDLATRQERFMNARVTRPTAGGARAYLGVTGEDADGGGVLILSVGDGTPAQAAGIKEGDVLLRWQDTALADQEQWRPLLREMRPGDVVAIVVRRDGTEVSLTCTLGGR